MRKVTAEERQILIDNPELVMFDPYKAMKNHSISLAKAVVVPMAFCMFFFIFAIRYDQFFERHGILMASFLFLGICISSAAVPLAYVYFDNSNYNKEKAVHYAGKLKKLLPVNLVCNKVRISRITYEKAEGEYIEDGKPQMFGYSAFVNIISLKPGDEVVYITDRKNFWAMVKRDVRTESFYVTEDE